VHQLVNKKTLTILFTKTEIHGSWNRRLHTAGLSNVCELQVSHLGNGKYHIKVKTRQSGPEKKLQENIKKFQEYNLSAKVQNATFSLGVPST
jgi:hypothetical protein